MIQKGVKVDVHCCDGCGRHAAYAVLDYGSLLLSREDVKLTRYRNPNYNWGEPEYVDLCDVCEDMGEFPVNERNWKSEGRVNFYVIGSE